METIRPWINTALLAVIAVLLAVQVVSAPAPPADLPTRICGQQPTDVSIPPTLCVPVTIIDFPEGYQNPFDQ